MAAIVILSLFRFDSTHDVAELETIFGFGNMCMRGTMRRHGMSVAS